MSARLEKPVLVRCASCGRNFTTRRVGHQECPACHAEIFLDTPDGAELVDEAEQPEQSPPAEPPQAEPAAEAGTPSTSDSENEPTQPSTEGIRRLIQLRDALQAAQERNFRPAWEEHGGNPVGRLIKTIKQIFSNPNRFFQILALDGVWRPLAFAWIISSLAMFFFALYGMWQLDRNSATLMNSISLKPGENPQQVIESLRSSLVFTLYGSPLLGLVNVLVSAGFYHVGIRLASERNAGLTATFRATCYGFTPLLLAVIPFIGHLVGGLWSLLLQIVALSHVHRITVSRASLAVLLPVTGVMLLLFAIL